MVNEIQGIGKLLELPDLEDETKQRINQTIRELLEQYMSPTPLSEVQQKQIGIDPFKAVQDAQQQAKELLGANTMNEWINGPEKT